MLRPVNPTSSSVASQTVTTLLTVSGSSNISGPIKYTSPSTPAVLAAGSTNDYNLGGALATANQFRLTANAAGSTVTGITAAATGTFIRVFNIGTTTASLTFAHENAGSSAANRIICPGEVDFILLPGDSVSLEYDGVVSRWRIVR